MTLLVATHDHRLVKSYPSRTLALMNRQVVDIDPETL
jgi:cell division transport system ATP-binding protein